VEHWGTTSPGRASEKLTDSSIDEVPARIVTSTREKIRCTLIVHDDRAREMA